MNGVLAYWRVFLNGALVTLGLSAMAILFGTAAAILLTVLVLFNIKPVKVVVNILVRLFRGLPPLLLLFIGYYGVAYLGYTINIVYATTLIFTLYGAAYLEEILRSGVESINYGQIEAADCIGLSFFDKVRYIILPQALKSSRSAMIGFYIGLIKDTSMASIIGFTELIHQSQTVASRTARPFEVYAVTAAIYFLICFPISKWNSYLDKKKGGRLS